MSLPAIVQPLVIVGPAILKWSGYTYYFKQGLKVNEARQTWTEEDDFAGKWDERVKSMKTTLAGMPVGMVSLLTTANGKSAMFPYPLTAVGSSIFGPAASPTPLVIQTQFGGTTNTGQSITYVRGGLSKHPTVNLKSQASLYGDVEFTCLGNPTVASLTAGSWNAIADSAFADTSYDDTQIISDIYTASYGTGSPYSAMGSHNGFELDMALALNEIMSDDYGITDLIIDSMGPATAKFAPNNLTQAQVTAMMNLQGSGYVQPGMSIGKAGTSLIVAGTGNGAHTLVGTITNAGPKSSGYTFDKKNNRVQEVMFGSRVSWTTGVRNGNLTFAVT